MPKKSPPVDADTSAIIEMAWDDETSFDAIEAQTGLSEKEVIALMRSNLKRSSFQVWRERVKGRASKHSKRRSAGEGRQP